MDKPFKKEKFKSPFGYSPFKDLVPNKSNIPEDFENKDLWFQWQAKWFYRGLEKAPIAKEGIDINDAMRHLAAIQSSWEPKHEDKQLYVAYLASLWLKEP